MFFFIVRLVVKSYTILIQDINQTLYLTMYVISVESDLDPLKTLFDISGLILARNLFSAQFALSHLLYLVL